MKPDARVVERVDIRQGRDASEFVEGQLVLGVGYGWQFIGIVQRDGDSLGAYGNFLGEHGPQWTDISDGEIEDGMWTIVADAPATDIDRLRSAVNAYDVESNFETLLDVFNAAKKVVAA